MSKVKSKEARIKRLNKQLNSYLDNPDHRNAKKLQERLNYIKNNK